MYNKLYLQNKKNFHNKIKNMGKKGNPMQCFTRGQDNMFVQNYCIINFRDEGLRTECMKRDQFCYMCCDTEIGLKDQGNLNCCYSRCDSLKKQSKCQQFYDVFHVTENIQINNSFP